jgi:hypothetical protein
MGFDSMREEELSNHGSHAQLHHLTMEEDWYLNHIVANQPTTTTTISLTSTTEQMTDQLMMEMRNKSLIFFFFFSLNYSEWKKPSLFFLLPDLHPFDRNPNFF